MLALLTLAATQVSVALVALGMECPSRTMQNSATNVAGQPSVSTSPHGAEAPAMPAQFAAHFGCSAASWLTEPRVQLRPLSHTRGTVSTHVLTVHRDCVTSPPFHPPRPL